MQLFTSLAPRPAPFRFRRSALIMQHTKPDAPAPTTEAQMQAFVAEEHRKSEARSEAAAAAGGQHLSRRESMEAEAQAVVDREDPCAVFVTFQVGRSRGREGLGHA